MAALSNEEFTDGDLDEWHFIAGGGFGNVYRARYKGNVFVAIKLLHQISGTHDALYREADCLKKMSSQFVLKVYGIYQGIAQPKIGEQQGIVMEFMERGSIETLQKKLRGPSPLQLGVRLAHQVALGMKHLHSNNFLHHDLKPGNVLLDKDFNAKLADFGFSKVSSSVFSNAEQSKPGTPGTVYYMPPESFDLTYKTVRSFDVYSYGILLWSILSGKEPYEGKNSDIVKFRIKKGDRPDVSLCLEDEKEKKEEIIALMKCCWDATPSYRPDFNEIVKSTGLVFSVHKDGIAAAIQEVSSKLEQNSKSSSLLVHTNAAEIVLSPPPENVVPNDVVDHPKVAAENTSVNDGIECMIEEKAKIVDEMRQDLIQKSTQVMAITKDLLEMGMVHPETYSEIKAKDTNEEKMRLLFRTSLRSGGDSVKAAFYDTLKKHEPNILSSNGDI